MSRFRGLKCKKQSIVRKKRSAITECETAIVCPNTGQFTSPLRNIPTKHTSVQLLVDELMRAFESPEIALNEGLQTPHRTNDVYVKVWHHYRTTIAVGIHSPH